MCASLPHRTLRLIDVENICGVGRPTDQEVMAAQADVERAVPPFVGDHEVVAVSGAASAQVALFTWRGSSRFVIRRGRDGADLALLDELADLEFVCSRYDRALIASGDHRFAQPARAIRTRGLDVLIVGRVGTTARAAIAAVGLANVALLPPTSRSSTLALAA